MPKISTPAPPKTRHTSITSPQSTDVTVPDCVNWRRGMYARTVHGMMKSIQEWQELVELAMAGALEGVGVGGNLTSADKRRL